MISKQDPSYFTAKAIDIITKFRFKIIDNNYTFIQNWFSKRGYYINIIIYINFYYICLLRN